VAFSPDRRLLALGCEDGTIKVVATNPLKEVRTLDAHIGDTSGMAFGAGDFALQDLGRPAFDLSDRGVEGRDAPGPVDAFLYTERGIYRPRETVQIVALLRDRIANALTGTPMTISVRRPDGVEYRRVALTDTDNRGAMHLPLVLSDTAPRGRWSAVAMIDFSVDLSVATS